ncbi:MAG TPA: hypothetical protein PKE66_04635 [Pyrinomonadaceae bacterium]|nr:hypothetical protein [Pyrinomonadaceae bacterium]
MLRSGDPELGPVESVHYVERPQSFVSFFVTTLVITAAAAGLTYIDAPVCAGVIMLILVPVTLDLLRGRKNSLTIHRNGLAYTGLFRTRTCRWEDVEEFGHILDNGTIPKDDPRYIRKARSFSVWIVKRNGESINIRPDLTGIYDAVRSIAVHVFGPEHVAAHPEDYGTGSIKTNRSD